MPGPFGWIVDRRCSEMGCTDRYGTFPPEIDPWTNELPPIAPQVKQKVHHIYYVSMVHCIGNLRLVVVRL